MKTPCRNAGIGADTTPEKREEELPVKDLVWELKRWI